MNRIELQQHNSNVRLNILKRIIRRYGPSRYYRHMNWIIRAVNARVPG
jgi:hypothetical protein